MSIGEVLSHLRADFPEVTVSKIRFLESEGLVAPHRAPSGYRKFSRDDLSRLRYVLAAQRDRYLPLRVIKAQLDAMDRGFEPPESPGGAPRLPRSLAVADGLPQAADFVVDSGADSASVRLSRGELLEASDLADDQLSQLEQFGMITSRGGRYDHAALAIAQAVGDMSRFGIEARHLRAFRTAVDREIGLFDQVIAPLARQRGPEARGRAEEAMRELAVLSVRLHAALLKTGLRSTLGS